MIDGMVTTAQYDQNGPRTHAAGVSFSGNVAFHLDRCFDQTLLCRQISGAFTLLAANVIPGNRRFEEMDLTRDYDGGEDW